MTLNVWGMGKWMSLYEKMCNEFQRPYSATNEEMVAPYENCRLGGTNHNIPGLSFGKQEVLERVDNKVALE